MDAREADVVVVGAGLSGLAAAFYLLKKDRGLRVFVLDAKDRVGGRTLTTQLKSADGTVDYWDVGGEWVGRPHPHLNYMLKTFQMDTFNPALPTGAVHAPIQPIPWACRLDLAIFTRKLKKLRERFLSVESHLHGYVDALECDSITVEQYRQKHLWTKDGKEIVDAACRSMFGLQSSDMTLLYFLMYINSAGGLHIFTKPHEYSGKECRVKGGFSQLSTQLVQRIGRRNVILDQPIVNIVQSTSGVTVVSSNRLQIKCQRVIMAIPPHQTVAIQYTPPLPSEKVNLLNSVPLAYMVKFIFTYEEAFWRDNGPNMDQSQFGFQSALTDPKLGIVGYVYDATSARGNPALVGFLTSSTSGPGSYENADDRLTAILGLLSDILGDSVHNYLDSDQKDWSQEPYNGGCFLKSLIPGTTKYFNSGLRDSFDRVHFAGTETATVWGGFMNGAVQAGFRAATEALYHIRPQLITSAEPDEYHLEDDLIAGLDEPQSWLSSPATIILSALGVTTAVTLGMFIFQRNRAPNWSIMNPFR